MRPKVSYLPPIGQGFKLIQGQVAPARVETTVGAVFVEEDGTIRLPLHCRVIVYGPGQGDFARAAVCDVETESLKLMPGFSATVFLLRPSSRTGEMSISWN